MSGCLHINSQQWNLWGADGLKFFLPRQRRDRSIYFQADWHFVPAGVDPATVPAATPKLRLSLIGIVPDLRDWRDLENLFLGYDEPIDGSKQLPDTRGPDMWLFQPGAISDPEFSKWETNLKFGARHGYEFEFSLEALKPTDRVSKYQVDYSMKQFFGQPLPPDWELPEWINEGDELRFEGRVQFRDILCSAPMNLAQPLVWAEKLARRELAVESFGPGSVHHADCPGKFKLREVTQAGRVVLLPMPVG